MTTKVFFFSYIAGPIFYFTTAQMGPEYLLKSYWFSFIFNKSARYNLLNFDTQFSFKGDLLI